MLLNYACDFGIVAYWFFRQDSVFTRWTAQDCVNAYTGIDNSQSNARNILAGVKSIKLTTRLEKTGVIKFLN